MRYQNPKGTDWIQPIMRGYKMMCCDCGLVHRMNFRVVLADEHGGRVLRQVDEKHRVQFQAARHNRSTAAARRKYETIRVIKGPKAKTR